VPGHGTKVLKDLKLLIVCRDKLLNVPVPIIYGHQLLTSRCNPGKSVLTGVKVALLLIPLS